MALQRFPCLALGSPCNAGYYFPPCSKDNVRKMLLGLWAQLEWVNSCRALCFSRSKGNSGAWSSLTFRVSWMCMLGEARQSVQRHCANSPQQLYEIPFGQLCPLYSCCQYTSILTCRPPFPCAASPKRSAALLMPVATILLLLDS